MNINSAADVRAVFAGGSIDHLHLSYEEYPIINASADTVSISGAFGWEHVQALAYWKAHREEFHPDAAATAAS